MINASPTDALGQLSLSHTALAVAVGVIHQKHAMESHLTELSQSSCTVVPLLVAPHCQPRPPFLMWPEIFVAPTYNECILLLPLAKGHLSNVATLSCQTGQTY